MIAWLTGTTVGKFIVTFFISMVPVVELRLGLPYGIALGLPYFTALTAAILGNMLPVPFIIIYIISLFFEQFMALTAVANAFKGIQVAVAFLILRAGLRLARKLPRRGFEMGLCAAAAAAVLAINGFGLRFSTVWLICCGGILGLLFRRAGKAGKGESR